MGRKLLHYLQAGYPGLYLVTPEEQRVEAEFKAIVHHLNTRPRREGEGPYTLCFWSVVDGLVNAENGQVQAQNDPLEILGAIANLPDRTVVLLKDYHLFLQDPNPILIRQLKDVLLEAKTKQKALILVGCRLVLPPELEREITVVEFELPGKDELRGVLQGILKSAGLPNLEEESREEVVSAASGLTTIEAENAFALAYVKHQKIDPQVVAQEKAQALKKNGLLEIVDTPDDLNSIGGLNVLKDWLLKRKGAFSQKAIHYGLPTPKGLLIMGIAGTGKSLTAKATAKVFNVPLLKLDAGKLYGGVVGQSEQNTRSVIQTAEALSPCVLWIDELEKGFSGSKSSGSTDGGTSARVFGAFLNWMQEKTKPVFIVATANDVSQLPPELLRKGRFDEVFFVDLPDQREREAIWNLVISSHRRNPRDYDVVQMARITQGFTGAEIKALFIEALYQAFEGEEEPTDLHLARLLNDTAPLSKLMGEQVEALRKWAKGRARMATTPPSSESPGRKMGV